jgi:hypothetical protein
MGSSSSKNNSSFFRDVQDKHDERQMNLIAWTKKKVELEVAVSKKYVSLSDDLEKAKGIGWTQQTGESVQTAIDRVLWTEYFGPAGLGSIFGLEFSVTIADPLLDGCPLIGCSTGFTKLSGYGMQDVIGRKSSFLTESVPAEEINQDSKKRSRDFCKAVKLGKKYTLPTNDQQASMREESQGDELFLMQKNARKDGRIFDNFTYMKVFELGSEMGKGQPYIVALQTEMGVGGLDAFSQMTSNLEELDATMENVKGALSALFFTMCSPTREPTPDSPALGKAPPSAFGKCRKQEKAEEEKTEGPSHAPMQLYQAFEPGEVQPWEKGRFRHLGKLNDAPRNKGAVYLARDEVTKELMAIKQMPNSWMQSSHTEFIQTHPAEFELPWQDIGCTRYLNSVNFKYACNLEGVYRSQDSTFVASTFASEGDLFNVATAGANPGPGLEREANLAPLVYQLCSGLKQLHDMQISHRDISLENVLLTRGPDKSAEVKIIDYSMATTERVFPCTAETLRGKLSYQAPEMHRQKKYDAFLSEVFAVGVLVYTLILKDYPWQSTVDGACKYFGFAEKHGMQEFFLRRTVRGSDLRVSQCASPSLLKMLEGMLEFDPSKRLTFGEKQLPGQRSVWDEQWMKSYMRKMASTKVHKS